MKARKFRSLSLRARLILSSTTITFLAIVGMGYYVYYRTQQANAYLTNQLDESVRQQAEDKLTAASAEQAAALNNFFGSMRKDITTIGATTERLISQEAALKNTNYWDASLSLSRLPNGSWDNPNTETASVFIPAKVELTDNLIAELNTTRQLDFIVPTILEANPDTVAIYFGGVSEETLYYPNIDLASIIPPDFDVTKRPWFVKAAPAQNPDHKAVWSDPYLDAALHGLVITSSIPVFDSAGNLRGVAAMDIQLNRITDIVSNVRVGETGYALLIDKDKRLIAMPEAGYKNFGIAPDTLPLGEVLDQTKVTTQIPPEFWAMLTKMASGQSGLETMPVNGVEHFVIYHPVPEAGYSLAIIVPAQELLAGAITAREQIAQVTKNTITVSIFLVSAILVVALLIAVGIGNSLTQPLSALTRTAEEITGGNLDAEAKVRRQDEIGILARTFNAMTAQLRDLIGTLEERVAERTADLAHRTTQLQAAAQVARQAAAIRDVSALLTNVATLISKQFGFYHTGIFILDDKSEYAVLQAVSSEGGQRMLEHGHQLQVGVQGIVGDAAKRQRPHIALDVGADAVFFDNPDLPLTRSEMALPLIAHDRVIGVLDIQSTEPEAFTQEDVEIMQTLADQIALAIENTRLLAESQSIIRQLEVVSANLSLHAWRERLRRQKHSYIYTPLGITPTTKEKATAPAPQSSDGKGRLDIPITLRGQTIGTITLQHKSQEAPWTDRDKELAMEIATQAALALENARLLEDTSQQAERERLESEISGRIHETLDIETILKTASDEIQRAFNLPEVVIRLVPPTETRLETKKKKGDTP